jgi:hypothetical protein
MGMLPSTPARESIEQRNYYYCTHLLKNLRDYDSFLLPTVDKHDDI